MSTGTHKSHLWHKPPLLQFWWEITFVTFLLEPIRHFWVQTKSLHFSDKKCRIWVFHDKTVLNTFLPHWITSHSLPIPSHHSANFAPKNCHIFCLGDVVPQPGFQTMSFNKHIISIPALRSQIWVEDILLKIRGVDKSVKPSFAANVINLLEPSSPTTQIRRKMMKLMSNVDKTVGKGRYWVGGDCVGSDANDLD